MQAIGRKPFILCPGLLSSISPSFHSRMGLLWLVKTSQEALETG